MDNTGELRQDHCNTILQLAIPLVGHDVVVSVCEFMAVNDLYLINFWPASDHWQFHDGEIYTTNAILREVNGHGDSE